MPPEFHRGDLNFQDGDIKLFPDDIVMTFVTEDLFLGKEDAIYYLSKSTYQQCSKWRPRWPPWYQNRNPTDLTRHAGMTFDDVSYLRFDE